jgi:AP-3 complex subunit mu
MINSIFILNKNGEVIIEKHYVGLVGRAICDKFWDAVTDVDDLQDVPPVLATPKWYLVHIQHHGLFFLAVVKNDTPPLLVLEFLQRVVEVFGHYMTDVTEESIKDKFVIVYQVLDEMMDGGFPFTTEPNVLTSMISKTNLLSELMENIPVPGTLNVPLPMSLGGKISMGSRAISLAAPIGTSNQLPRAAGSTVPWRTVGVKYTTNEVYFDINEEIDAIIDRNGHVLRCVAHGNVQVNCKLSGMPDLSLLFYNPRVLEDVAFHPCIRYSRWDQSKVLSFVPPDGAFKLMEYRVTSGLEIPLSVKPQVSWTNGGGRVHITVSAKMSVKHAVGDVQLTIPFSKLVSSTNLTATAGEVQYDEINKVCIWKVGKVGREKSPILSGNISVLPGSPQPDSNPIIEVGFRVNQFSASGIRVESLSLHNEKYKPYKGVKNITYAGNFQVRT